MRSPIDRVGRKERRAKNIATFRSFDKCEQSAEETEKKQPMKKIK